MHGLWRGWHRVRPGGRRLHAGGSGQGRVRTCRIEPKALSLAEQWINQRRAEWEQHFDQLGEYLNTLVKGEGTHAKDK